MKKRNRIVLLALLLMSAMIVTAEGNAPGGQEPMTLRALGAIGDGHSDDRAAIEAALNNAMGAPVDGEGLTYAVRGNIVITTDVDLRNTTLLQTMESVDMSKYIPSAREGGEIQVDPPEAFREMLRDLPNMTAFGIGTYASDPVLDEAALAEVLPSIALRTLVIRGEEEKPISVRLEKMKVDRGKHPDSGGRNDGAGVRIEHASPVDVRDLEVTGDGKGTGLIVSFCSKVRIEGLNIHDMTWAPYAGDNVFDLLPVESVRDDFGWNNFPIYEYRENLKRFVRVRIQEQLVGIFVISSQDVEILDARIHRLQTKIGDELFPLQADGMTINRTVNVVIQDCEITKVWEGIDFTGATGSDFVFENCTVADTLGWAIKLAHPKQNGKLIDCTTTRAGIAGFVTGGDSDNVQWINCKALETGANNYWTRADGSHVMKICGMYIEGRGTGTDETPRKLTIDHFSAINEENPGAMDYGIFCDADNLEERDIRLIAPTVRGARIKDVEGIVPIINP